MQLQIRRFKTTDAPAAAALIVLRRGIEKIQTLS